ncbi:hypothetical protein GCM10023224_13590 [Streptomonospora halophila]|uniref:Uncharacterized protein n=1 Tax=Streptomonospora halophila TaxID=427369 RepID=A0ABP9G9Q3_9ACTN
MISADALDMSSLSPLLVALARGEETPGEGDVEGVEGFAEAVGETSREVAMSSDNVSERVSGRTTGMCITVPIW